MRFVLSLTFLLSLLFGVPGESWAARVELFDANGKQVKDYDEQIDFLRATTNNTVVIGNTEIREKKYLGSGDTTSIFSLSEDKPFIDADGRVIERAIRFPIAKGRHPSGTPYVEYLRRFVSAMKALERAGVRTVKVFESDSKLVPVPQYVIVERVHEIFKLRELLANLKNPNSPLKPAERDRYLAALEKFFESTWNFEVIGDFNPNQLVWNGREWVVLDALHDHKTYDGRTTYSVAESLKGHVSEELLERMRTVIQRKRMQVRCENPLLLHDFND